MKQFLRRMFSQLWQSSNANHKLTYLLEMMSSDYVQRHLYGNPRYADPKKLNRYEQKVYSQTGEDGILEEIFRRIGTTNKVFVEFGVGDGLENNTTYLMLKSWRGFWIEGNAGAIDGIRRTFAEQIRSGVLAVQQAFITAENIETLFRSAGVPEELDLLSVDIDGNDYWVWKAITTYRPRVVVIEYNATFPPPTRWIKSYQPDYWWDGTTNFSASLTSLEELGYQKGYRLVGCTFNGVNAFFVREECLEEHFLSPFTAEHHYEPSRYFLQQQKGHKRGFTSFVVE